MSWLEHIFFILATMNVMWSAHIISRELAKLNKNFEVPYAPRRDVQMQPQMKDMHANPKR